MVLNKRTEEVWVDLYCINTESVFDLLSFVDVLNNQEAIRARKFRNDFDQKSYLLSHILLRILLSSYFDIDPVEWVFAFNKYGKPMQLNFPNEIFFNISHTKNMICISFSNALRVGVDVENVTKKNINILKSVFKSQTSYYSDMNYVSEWTSREAFLKGLGLGLSNFSDDDNFYENLLFNVDKSCWTILTLSTFDNQYCISLAHELRDEKPYVRVLDHNFKSCYYGMNLVSIKTYKS